MRERNSFGPGKAGKLETKNFSAFWEVERKVENFEKQKQRRKFIRRKILRNRKRVNRYAKEFEDREQSKRHRCSWLVNEQLNEVKAKLKAVKNFFQSDLTKDFRKMNDYFEKLVWRNFSVRSKYGAMKAFYSNTFLAKISWKRCFYKKLRS